ncbi:hypothetical protein CONLIGDRAFT_636653 [Coniochaeta ligniaria NRRL 30616]|uniref:Myb-like domain-containing protein n=1 Tax=Coniochaeta ligniaria NRRL 30616 TaxID=1408157 RepID=A0A1J7IAI8_9PEZI|nr:hypothetical protein CONLIGDRAFT_636653 [Coniochaeta ligniaria NRRL 30616]
MLHCGKYVGSSVDMRGGGARLDNHTKAALTKTSREKKQRHHAELCKEGTEANLRILAVFGCDDQIKPYVPLVETIFIALLGTFVGQEKPRMYNPQPCYDLYDRIRYRAMMPDIDGNGLNGALPIYQGMVGVSSGRQTYRCVTCDQELAPNTSQRNHSRLVEPGNPLGPRRCIACEIIFADTGEERIRAADGSYKRISEPREKHKLWVTAGHADVCGNLACAAPRASGAGFNGWMEQSRCQNCASFLSYQKRRRVPDSQIKERQPQELELTARSHIWSEAEDQILSAKRTEGLKFQEIVARHFPKLNALLLSERHTFLKRKERKAKRTTMPKESTKAPDWTDDEIKILRNAMMSKETARAMLPLLPQRTISSIVTKMSYLRKTINQST